MNEADTHLYTEPIIKKTTSSTMYGLEVWLSSLLVSTDMHALTITLSPQDLRQTSSRGALGEKGARAAIDGTGTLGMTCNGNGPKVLAQSSDYPRADN